MRTGPKPRDPMERFAEKYVEIPWSGCWIWTGAINGGRYGQLVMFSRSDTSLNKRKMDAHRASWVLHRGEIPAGMMVCHSCDVRECVNPAHLFLGSQTDNMQDASRKGRLRQPENKTHCAKGHEMVGENLVWRSGYRLCRACDREKSRRHYWKNAETERARRRELYANKSVRRK